MFSVDEWLKTVEMKKFVVHGTFLQNKITPIICQKKNTFTTSKIGGSLSISRETTPNVYTKKLEKTLLEVPRTAIVIELFFLLVAMERILVVFLRIQRKSRKKRQAKACDRTEQPVVYRTLAKNSDEWIPIIHSITDRSFTADGGLL